MSALPVPAVDPRPPSRPRLRLVHGTGDGPVGGGGRDPLAPMTRAQAWRRRIAVLVALAAAVVLMVMAVVGGGEAALSVTPVADVTVVVEPGETVWDIAAAHAPAGVATGEYVGLIVELNGLDGGVVDSWQVLRLPAA